MLVEPAGDRSRRDELRTEFTAGGSNDAEIATPTNEPALPPSTDSATPAPEGRAIILPTDKRVKSPLKIDTMRLEIRLKML